MPPKAKAMDSYEQVEVTSRAELRAWLEENHGRDEGIWLITYKKHRQDRHIPWSSIVQEALCFGWIDSTVKRIDEDRVRRLFTPRRPGSIWSAVNKRHITELIAEGLMRPQGMARVEAAKADGSWTFLDDIDALIVPDDLAAALAADPRAQSNFEGFSKSRKKNLLYWVKTAKRAPTREKRIAAVVAGAALGKSALD